VRRLAKAVQHAYQRHISTQERQFEFTHPLTAEVYLAQFTAFPNNFNKNWEVITLAPMSDFLVGLNEINRRLIVYGGAACLLLVFLTYILSRTISRPIETLTEEIRDLLDFNRSKKIVGSRIEEINILHGAVNKLRNTLRAFTAYVPRDLVNDLVRSGNDIELGGESRYLTILFTDLQGFSSISEVTPSRELVRLVSSYLALVTYAVKEETGTVDKFIGDSVMAFWGAPDARSEPRLSRLQSGREVTTQDGGIEQAIRYGRSAPVDGPHWHPLGCRSGGKYWIT
jgi:adenylate cyclase